MKILSSRVTWGILLILAGIFFLVQNLFFPGAGDLIWAFFLGIGALYFLGYFITNRSQWWALIPGVILATLTGLIIVSRIAGDAGDAWGGTILFGGISLAFILVYLLNRSQWWALIPGGVILTLALVSSPLLEGSGEEGSVFFLGLGLTFMLIGILPTGRERSRQSWALIPGTALLAVGALVSAFATDLSGYIWPVALIAGGGALLVQTLTGRRT